MSTDFLSSVRLAHTSFASKQMFWFLGTDEPVGLTLETHPFRFLRDGNVSHLLGFILHL